MFYLFAIHLVKHYSLQKASWYFHEEGHGKGAPDGIGAYVKRTADRHVALGKDIADLETLYKTLIAVETKVDVFLVKEEEIRAADELLASVPQLKTIKNTMRVHHVQWNILEPHTIYLRRTEEDYSPKIVFKRPRRQMMCLSDSSNSEDAVPVEGTAGKNHNDLTSRDRKMTFNLEILRLTHTLLLNEAFPSEESNVEFSEETDSSGDSGCDTSKKDKKKTKKKLTKSRKLAMKEHQEI
ncbi:unnamed protein product [Arctia plantaginis]|uniref:Uncharacterized protein n=1 Tax=Arctia plantaginis TaxID=874455 RepID=A0A8S1B0J2_ARCPL|nr:unnamed protein product [Arctia plantaginis]